MKHAAQIDEYGIVMQVICGSVEWAEARLGGRWVSTTKHDGDVSYAGVGYTYDEQREAFIAPRPYPSWMLNEDTCLWESPVPTPDDGQSYRWDEDTVSWVPVDKGP